MVFSNSDNVASSGVPCASKPFVVAPALRAMLHPMSEPVAIAATFCPALRRVRAFSICCIAGCNIAPRVKPGFH